MSLYSFYLVHKNFLSNVLYDSNFLEANNETWKYGTPLNAMKFTGRPSFNVSLMVIVGVSSLVAVVCFMLK